MTRERAHERCTVCDDFIPLSRRVDADTCSEKCRTKRLNDRKRVVLKLGHQFIEKHTIAQLEARLSEDEFELLSHEIASRAKSPAPKRRRFEGGRPRLSKHAWQQLAAIANRKGVSPSAYLEQILREIFKT